MLTRRRLAWTAGALAAGLGLWRLGVAESGPVELSGLTMGTSYSVKIAAAMSPGERAAAGVLIETTLARIDGLMSTFDPASELSRFNAHRGLEPVPISEELTRVLATAARVTARSGGAFDVTVGPLVRAWGFGPDDLPIHPPDGVELEELRARVGPDRIRLDAAAGTVAKADPRVELDLSGIAKGFAVERVVAALSQRGYRRFLVDVGGELEAVGRGPGGGPWTIGLERPGEAPGDLHGTIRLRDLAIATSGDYRNFYDDGETRYAHIVDPRTGRPVPWVGASVSVVSVDASEADAWATALSVLGVDEGYDLALREGLAALFLWRDGGAVRSRWTPELPERVEGFDEIGGS